MNCRHAFVLVLALAFILGGSSFGRDMESYKKNIPADSDVKKINLDAEIGVANLIISSHEGGDILTANVDYDADRIEVDVEYERQKTTADLYILSENLSSRRHHLDSDDCEMDLSLSGDYVWDINLDIGFTESEMEFSGLPIERLQMDIGASECRVVFSQPNPERMRKLNIDAGAGNVEIMGLGFANFEHISFDGGAGEFVLNFDGLEEGFRSARIDIGVGEVIIEIPKDLPIRIETNDNWLSSLKIRGSEIEEVDDGVYESENFEDAEYGLEIDLDLGIGKATIGWADGSGTILTARSTDRDQFFLSDLFFSNVSYIPELPALPELPELPDLPILSDFCELPALPAMPALPALPALPSGRKVLD